jgi:hypothetical protein
MLDEDAHFGMIAETSILLVKAEVGWVKVDNQRWGTAFVLSQDMGLFRHYRSNMVSIEHQAAGAWQDRP